MKIRCMAVDDEPLALALVCNYIEKTPFLELVSKSTGALNAVDLLNERSIDLLFLDVQMPDLTGVELARSIVGSGPKIVFTTAFNNFALEGFKLDALDYLLKPFSYEEFLRTANKAKKHFDLVQKASEPAASEGKNDYIFVKSEHQLIKIQFDDVLYIEGLKDYVKIYLTSQPRPVLSLMSLKTLEDRLPSAQFMRVHRSYIVSLGKIKMVYRNQINFGRDEFVPISAQYKDDFGAFVEKKL